MSGKMPADNCPPAVSLYMGLGRVSEPSELSGGYAAGRLPALASLAFPRTVDLSRDAWLEPFRRRPIVVLSPHFDDACFSLGSFLQAVGHGELINIFTEGAYLARRTPKNASAPDQRKVYSIRDNEDFAFALRCGLTRHDLGCEEPLLRGRRTGDMQHIEDDVAQITGPILTTLEKIAGAFSSGERGFLFCPLGIGRHVNHRATAEAALRCIPEIAKRYEILFYEDLPYAAKPLDRFRALSRVDRRLNGDLSTRFVLTPAWPDKKSLVGLYPTQLRGRPHRRRFLPAALWPRAPHEAFWSVGRKFVSE